MIELCLAILFPYSECTTSHNLFDVFIYRQDYLACQCACFLFLVWNDAIAILALLLARLTTRSQFDRSRDLILIEIIMPETFMSVDSCLPSLLV